MVHPRRQQSSAAPGCRFDYTCLEYHIWLQFKNSGTTTGLVKTWRCVFTALVLRLLWWCHREEQKMTCDQYLCHCSLSSRIQRLRSCCLTWTFVLRFRSLGNILCELNTSFAFEHFLRLLTFLWWYHTVKVNEMQRGGEGRRWPGSRRHTHTQTKDNKHQNLIMWLCSWVSVTSSHLEIKDWSSTGETLINFVSQLFFFFFGDMKVVLSRYQHFQ